jgi:hypothetical protein
MRMDGQPRRAPPPGRHERAAATRDQEPPTGMSSAPRGQATPPSPSVPGEPSHRDGSARASRWAAYAGRCASGEGAPGLRAGALRLAGRSAWHGPGSSAHASPRGQAGGVGHPGRERAVEGVVGPGLRRSGERAAEEGKASCRGHRGPGFQVLAGGKGRSGARIRAGEIAGQRSITSRGHGGRVSENCMSVLLGSRESATHWLLDAVRPRPMDAGDRHEQLRLGALMPGLIDA